MEEFILKIEGMSCNHCVMRVKKALEGVKGVTNAEVSIGSAKVICSECKREDLEKAVKDAGYRVVG